MFDSAYKLKNIDPTPNALFATILILVLIRNIHDDHEIKKILYLYCFPGQFSAKIALLVLVIESSQDFLYL